MPDQTYLKTVPTTRNLSQGIVTATRYELYEKFGFGDKIIERYLNYGTANQRTQTYQYYTDMSDYGYGKVSQRIDYDGKWTKYEYDVNGRIIKEVSPFGDAVITAPENQCQIITYDYTKLDSSESSDSSDNPRWRTKVTTICGQETAREFRQYFSNRELEIVAINPGMAYTDASNRVTTTYFTEFYDYECEETIRRDTKVENPDGTSSEMSYVTGSYYNQSAGIYVSTLQKTTLHKFLTNSLSREIELKDQFGTIESYRHYDLAGGTVLLVEGYDQAIDRYGHPLTKTDVDGHVTAYSYYTALVPDGNYTNSIPYDHVQTTKPDGSVLVEAFDEWENKIFELYDGITTFYHYNAYGNVIETIITGRNGGILTTSTAYTDDNVKVSETDANGNVTTYTYGVAWDAETDALNNVFKNEYFLDGRLKNTKVNNAVKNYYTYEITGNELVTTEYASETEWNKSVTAFDRNVRQKNYPDGYVQNFYFDEYGRQGRIEDNCNNKTRNIYNSVTGELYQQWRNGILTEFASGYAVDDDTAEIYRYDRSYSYYQENRILISENRAYRNGLKTYSFNSGNSSFVVKEYCGNGKVTETVTADSIITIKVYQNEVLQSSQTKTTGITECTYDEFNRAIGYDYTENSLEKKLRYTFDSNGNVVTFMQGVNNKNRIYSYEFDVINRRTRETTPEGLKINYFYNAHGQFIKITGGTYPQEYAYDIQGRMTSFTTYRDNNTSEVTTFEYDNRGWMCRKTYDDENTEEYTYRGDGSIANVANAREQVIQCSYDALNRMVAMQGADIYWEFSYDYRGLLLRACNGAYHQNFSYDAYGRLTSENFSDIPNTEIAHTYDGFNRLTGYSFDGEQVHYIYAPNTGVLNSVNCDGWNFVYNRISGSNKLFQTIARLNDKTINTVTRSYNSFGDLTAVGDYGYTLDLDGKRLSATLPDGKAWAYSYDGLSQVTGGVLSNHTTPISSHAYTFDMIGNRLTSNDNGNSKQYTSNNLNQYTTINSTNLTYDADGNMLSDGQFTYGYDALNQLVSVENATDKQVFIYDFMGRRIITESYMKNGEDWIRVTRRRYIYQGWNVIAEYVNGAKNKTYVWGEDISGTMQGAGGVGGLLLERNSNGHYLPIYDGNGNIIAYKNSLGNIVAMYSYDPFGNIILHGGLNFNYTFSTKPQDDLSKLYYYGYRFYHSAFGRWINRDPIKEEGGKNIYTMLNNDLNNNIDKLGLANVCCASADLSWPLNLLNHCEISYGGCPPGRDWTSYPIEKDNSSGRNMDNGKSCNCVKDSDIKDCLTRNPYSRGRGRWGSNCQTSVIRSIARCCMKTKWRPNLYAGNPRGKCIKTKIFVVPPRNVVTVCIEWEFPEWRS